MIKNIITYFYVILCVCTYQQTYTMGYGLTELTPNATKLSTNLSEVLGSWIKVEEMPISEIHPNIPENNDNIQPSPTPSNYWELIRDISGNTARVATAVPLATKAIIDCKAAMQYEDGPVQPVIFSQEELEQRNIEHKHSQERLQSIDALLKNTNGTFQSFTQTLLAGTQLTQHVAALMKTFQQNPADKGKEEAICPHKEQIAVEKQRTAERRHFIFLGNQVVGVLESSSAAVQQLTSFAAQTNKNLKTIERIFALKNEADSSRFQPTTTEHIRMLHKHSLALNAQQVQMTNNIAIATENLAEVSRFGANIANTAQLMLTSPHYDHKVTHTKNNIVKTFASMSSVLVGSLLLYKHLTNHVDQKSTILALVGVGLITFPWALSYIDQ